MKLSELQIGDAVVLDGDRYVNGTYKWNHLTLVEVSKVFTKMIEVVEKGQVYRFSKASGSQLKPNGLNGNWEICDNWKISIPTPEQMATFDGYKGNSTETAIRLANESAISETVEALKVFLDQTSPEFTSRLSNVRALIGAVSNVDKPIESYSEAVTRLEIENRALQAKLDAIQAILQ